MNKNDNRNCYTYLIGWSNLDIWYYGVKYGKDAHPQNFWKTYFSSSDIVAKFIKNNGQPNVIELRKIFGNDPVKAVKWEATVLRRMNVPNNKKFLNGHCAGAGYKATLQSSKTNKNMIMSKHKITGEFKRISKYSDEWLSGDYVGMNSGIQCPESTKIASSKTHKGIPKTRKTRERMSISQKNSIWIHNFETNITARLTKGITIIPDGYVKVCGPHLLMTLEEKTKRDLDHKASVKEETLKRKDISKMNNSIAQQKFNQENPLNRLKEEDYILIEKIFEIYKLFPAVPNKNSIGKNISYNRSFANEYMKILNCSHHKIFTIIENEKPNTMKALKNLNRFIEHHDIIDHIIQHANY